jgi:hypothetical protein
MFLDRGDAIGNEKRHRLVRIGLGVFLLGIVVYIAIGFIPGMSCSWWRRIDADHLRVTCITTSIQGKQEYREGGHLYFGSKVDIDLHLWVSVINRTLLCRDVGGGIPTIFHYTKYYLGLTEPNLSTVVEKEKGTYPLDKEGEYYYYGREDVSIARNEGNVCVPYDLDEYELSTTMTTGDLCHSSVPCVVFFSMRVLMVVLFVYWPAFILTFPYFRDREGGV